MNIYNDAISDLKQIFNNIEGFELSFSKLTQEDKDKLMNDKIVKKLLPEIISFGEKLSKKN